MGAHVNFQVKFILASPDVWATKQYNCLCSLRCSRKLIWPKPAVALYTSSQNMRKLLVSCRGRICVKWACHCLIPWDLIWLGNQAADKYTLQQMLQICLGWRIRGTEVKFCFRISCFNIHTYIHTWGIHDLMDTVGRRYPLRWLKFKSWVRLCISHRVNTLGMNPNIIPLAMGK